MRTQVFKFSPAAYMRGEAMLPTAVVNLQASLNYAVQNIPSPYWNDQEKHTQMTWSAFAFRDALHEVTDMLGLASAIWRKPAVAAPAADEGGAWEVDAMRPLTLIEPERSNREEVLA